MTFVLPLGALIACQLASSGLMVALSTWIIRAPSGGLAAVGHLVGAQTFAALWELKRPGFVPPRRGALAGAATAVHVALGAAYFALFPMNDPGLVVEDPKKKVIFVALVVTMGALISFGATWLGLTQGARLGQRGRK